MAESPYGRAGRPTLEAVAELAGVSRATASRVITGSPRVSAKSRAAVEAAVSELGYLPNLAARSLVTQRTDAVAVVVSEPESRVFTDPFFGAMIRGISRGLAGALSDDGSLTGRGHPWARGLMTALGGVGHVAVPGAGLPHCDDGRGDRGSG